MKYLSLGPMIKTRWPKLRKCNVVDSDTVTPCSLVGGYQCFGGTNRLHLQGDMVFRVTTWRHNPEDHTASSPP
jgi:hypothetical protein